MISSLASPTVRRENQARYSGLVVFAALALSLFLQAFLPLRIPRLNVFELPLLIVIYFAVAWRSPITGTVLGAAVGLFQDGLSHQPFGVNGIAKTAIGFLAASIGLKIDVENPATRLLMSFGFTLLHSFLFYAIMRHFVAIDLGWIWLHELLKAAINAVLGVALFTLLDRLRVRE